MDKSLARYIWKHTHAHQLWILLVVLLSMIPYYMSFDLPKLIVNGATAQEMRALAESQGMRTMSREAVELVAADITTIDEVINNVVVS